MIDFPNPYGCRKFKFNYTKKSESIFHLVQVINENLVLAVEEGYSFPA